MTVSVVIDDEEIMLKKIGFDCIDFEFIRPISISIPNDFRIPKIFGNTTLPKNSPNKREFSREMQDQYSKIHSEELNCILEDVCESLSLKLLLTIAM